MLSDCARCHLVMCLAYLVNVLSRNCQFLGTVDANYEYTYHVEHLFDTPTLSISEQSSRTAPFLAATP
jgi:hypothetical protein